MHSPAEQHVPPGDERPGVAFADTSSGSAGRRAVEWLLRALTLAALIGLLVVSTRDEADRHPVQAAGRDMADALQHWTMQGAPEEASVIFDVPPDPATRDWLAALGVAGTRVRWSGAKPLPAGLAAEAVADPDHPIRLLVAAPPGATISLADALGDVGVGLTASTGARITVPGLSGFVDARVSSGGEDTSSAGVGASSAPRDVATGMSAPLADSLLLRPILLLGQAGWEAKFVLAALEERGWEVDARLAVAPSGDLRQGRGTIQIDTARYSAVVAIDSVAARYATALRRYVESGGGLVVVGAGSRVSGLAPLYPARIMTSTSPPGSFAEDTVQPRTALALASLVEMDARATPIEMRDSLVAAAAWLVGEGRVLQVGYHDTWRWRMAGVEEDPVAAHRSWWNAMVASVAYAPAVAESRPARHESAPLAALYSALGPPSGSGPEWRATLFGDPRLVPFLFALLLGALLLEVWLRRARGAA